jgi:hypothetical protein
MLASTYLLLLLLVWWRTEVCGTCQLELCTVQCELSIHTHAQCY